MVDVKSWNPQMKRKIKIYANHLLRIFKSYFTECNSMDIFVSGDVLQGSAVEAMLYHFTYDELPSLQLEDDWEPIGFSYHTLVVITSKNIADL